jgi:hypothetical protein
MRATRLDASPPPHPEAVHQQSHDQDDLFRVEPKVDQPRGRKDGFGIGPRLQARIGVVAPNQANGAVQSLEQFEAHAAGLRYFSR